MGAITDKIFELLESGNNIEEHRSTGLIIRSQANFIDAAYEGIGDDRPKKKANTVIDQGDLYSRRHQAISDIP